MHDRQPAVHILDAAVALTPQAGNAWAGHTSPAYANMVGPFGGTIGATLLNAVMLHPERLGDPMFRTKNFTGRPARPELVRGIVQGEDLVQYDFTPQQYTALIKLTAALAKIFPKIKLDYPRDAAGRLVLQKLPEEELAKYQGVLGHFHIQTNKTDPGPALQWDTVIDGARQLLRLRAIKRPAASSQTPDQP